MTQPGIADGFSLLRDPNVCKMFVAYLVSYTGTSMAPIAIAFGVLELTGSARDSAIVIAAPTAASIVVLLLGGVIADRTSRHRIIYRAEAVAMLAQLSMALLFITDHATVAWLTALMLLNGIAMAFHTPAATGLIIQLVDTRDLQAVNALLGTARNGAMAGGAALGGVLVATIGAGGALLVDAISFGISAILVFTLKPRLQRPTEAASLMSDLRLGWREFISHTWLWAIVLQFSLIVAAIEAVFGLLGPAIARSHMNGAVDWGLVASGFGIGTLLGGVLAMKVRPRFPMRFASALVFFFSAVPLTLSVPLPVFAVMAAAVVSGTAGQIFAVIWYTTLQIKVPNEMLSRVSAYDHLGSIVLAPLGIVVGGIMYEELGYRTTVLIAAATVILPTLAVLLVRDVRQMTNQA